MENDLAFEIRSMILKKGAVKFGSFKLKLHEEKPDAPTSPFYFNLRSPDNPKPGPLQPEDFNLIALGLWRIIFKKIPRIEAIAGIPRAGEPIAEAMRKFLGQENDDPRFIKPFTKKEEGGKRKIVLSEELQLRKGEDVILIDDLITQAHTKVEAIKAIRSGGGNVRHLVVLIDREQGGTEELEKMGVEVHYYFTASELFEGYQLDELISFSVYDDYCIQYIKDNK